MRPVLMKESLKRKLRSVILRFLKFFIVDNLQIRLVLPVYDTHGERSG